MCMYELYVSFFATCHTFFMLNSSASTTWTHPGRTVRCAQQVESHIGFAQFGDAAAQAHEARGSH